MKKLLDAKILFLLGLLLCIPVIIPYFHSGYFPTHDGLWAVVRAGEMFREIRDHQFPPRYSSVLNYGYGYPLFNFTYPFPYYLATILHLFKFGFISSIKTIFLLSVVFSYAGMFLLVKKQYKSTLIAFLAGLLYIYLPYRMVDLYVRGSIGESVSFAIYPFLLLTSLMVLENKKQGFSFLLTPLLVTSLVLAHNISAVYFGIIFLVLFIFGLATKNKNARYLLGSFVWGGFLSAFFLVPALFEKNNILLSVIPIADRALYYVSLPQLLFSPWGYGTPTDKTPFTYQAGFGQILGFLTSLVFLIKQKHFLKPEFFLSVLVVVFLFMLFPASFFLWKLPLLSEINYPWTLLLPLGFLMCFLSAFFVKQVKYGVPLLGVFVFISIAFTFNYAKPEKYLYYPDSYYLTNEATTTSSQELMPLWVKKMPVSRFDNKVEAKGNADNLKYNSKNITFTLNSDAPQNVIVNQIYYPGWKAYVNGSEVKVNFKNEKGIMQISILPGNNTVHLRFTETPLRLASDIVSAISFIILLASIARFAYAFYYGKKRKK
ncbi:MAG: 6-pyruvoyl-tetrahydropterin synthase-related protein [Candidatus Levyibacteriota bacterium]